MTTKQPELHIELKALLARYGLTSCYMVARALNGSIQECWVSSDVTLEMMAERFARRRVDAFFDGVQLASSAPGDKAVQ